MDRLVCVSLNFFLHSLYDLVLSLRDISLFKDLDFLALLSTSKDRLDLDHCSHQFLVFLQFFHWLQFLFFLVPILCIERLVSDIQQSRMLGEDLKVLGGQLEACLYSLSLS